MSTAALLDAQPRLRRDVLLGGAVLRGPGEIYRVKDLRSGRAFEVSGKEHFLLERLDGTRSLAAIGDDYAAVFGRRLGEAHWRQFVGLLAARELLVPGDEPHTATPEASEPSAPGIVVAAQRLVGFAITGGVLWPLLGMVVAMELYLALHLGELLDGGRWLLERPLLLIGVAGLVWFSAALHELGHGLAARHFGCPVTGISLLTLRCTVDSYLYLRSPLRQIVIAGSGALVNAALLLPIAVVWVVLPTSSEARPALAGLLLVGSAQAMLNLIPLAPLDGYKMLGHGLRVAHLTTESRRFVHLLLRRAVGRGPGAAAYRSKARLLYGLYALFGVVAATGAAVGVLLACRRLVTERFGSPGVVITIAVLSMTLAGWLARPADSRTRPTTPKEEIR
ncbi:metalloprotease [Cryptosporangium minutisporangium]|uniref:Peptidase M50 n=1 Tax=Cryptosporangium minutisporangium TaxID=113569 RepID=A0ABP6SRL3_9ACTN